MFVPLLCLICVSTVLLTEGERIEKVQYSTWYLAMNLNPADGHIMGYTTGWTDNNFIGTYAEALTKDYLNRIVWNHPVSYIAIARHQKGKVDAVKVFRFKESARSLQSRFLAMDPGREVVTEGGPLQESVSKNAQNMDDDPIFSVGGDLAFNWGYSDNGHRIVLTGGYLSALGVNDDNTHGLGNDFACNPLTGSSPDNKHWPHEISNIQDCPLVTEKLQTPDQSATGIWAKMPGLFCSVFHCTCRNVRVQGTDHGPGSHLKSGPVYGNYAIFVSEDATSFPLPGNTLGLEIDVIPKLKFFNN